MAHNKEDRIIRLGYLCRWGSIALTILVPMVVFGICELLNASSNTVTISLFLSWGLTFLGIGVYEIIGTALEFKHVLVSLQLCSHHTSNVNPRRGWNKSDKKDGFGSGIIFSVIGSAALVIGVLSICGIIN